jgi:putative solute:sodium symporter small subunit
LKQIQKSDFKQGGVMQSSRREEYWSRNLRITAILMAVWFFVTYVIAFFARDLSFTIFGWPFSFYMAAQGSLVIYVLIIWYYARYMSQLDREFGVEEEEEQ